MELIGFDGIQALLELQHGDYGYSTCFDYIDSLHRRDEMPQFGITIFVEPCGDITKWGESFQAVAKWWQEVFLSQPKEWDYVQAGWWLMDQEEKLPDSATDCWLKHEPDQG